MEFGSSAFGIGLLKIIGIDIVLSGDNALVIALACRSLPTEKRKWGVLMGTGAAIVLRIAFAAAIVYVLEVPFLKLTGALLLVWIAVKLVAPTGGDGVSHLGAQEATSLWQAVKIVAIADAVMSLDNVLAVAAAAKGSVTLLALGIAISIPLMVVGSAMMLWLLDRVPVLAVAGAGLLGWIAGELAVHDHIAGPWIAMHIPWLPAALPAIICMGVMAFGLLLRWKAARHPESDRTPGNEGQRRRAAEEPT
ncbi:TerC family protein [Mesorhizobium sp. LHD-90]|uniref:TerC family protein n=1 Tax=Mesorhizobium sp. LHD-90 TaxID=3071414 RepID=UPI0027DEF506|nr:TerC family protein [Mesorhizobium sp. LHD-90]MDQ6436826.1 TerC family protein [Mesorhizobium sp. LHD-90]